MARNRDSRSRRGGRGPRRCSGRSARRRVEVEVQEEIGRLGPIGPPGRLAVAGAQQAESALEGDGQVAARRLAVDVGQPARAGPGRLEEGPRRRSSASSCAMKPDFCDRRPDAQAIRSPSAFQAIASTQTPGRAAKPAYVGGSSSKSIQSSTCAG